MLWRNYYEPLSTTHYNTASNCMVQLVQ